MDVKYAFGIWGFISAVLLIFSLIDCAREKGNLVKYEIAAPLAWVIVAVIPCLAFYLIVWIAKLF